MRGTGRTSRPYLAIGYRAESSAFGPARRFRFNRCQTTCLWKQAWRPGRPSSAITRPCASRRVGFVASSGNPPSRVTNRDWLYCRTDGVLPSCAMRWQVDSVALLLDDERRTVVWAELAELHLLPQDAWEGCFDELAVLAADTQQLMQVETQHGLLATTSWKRSRAYARGNPAETASWVHGVQPVWSLDVLWLPADSIRWRRFFSAEEVLLSRILPQRVVQRSSLAGIGRPCRKDHNADGGPRPSSSSGLHAQHPNWRHGGLGARFRRVEPDRYPSGDGCRARRRA